MSDNKINQSTVRSQNKIIPMFLIGTFVFTYILWGSIGIGNQFGVLQYETPVSMILFFLGGWAPTVMGIVCAHKSGKIAGPKDLLKGCFNLKQQFSTYAFVILFLAVYYAILIVMGCTTKIDYLYMWILSLPITIVFGGLEELGWRYILQPELEKSLPFVLSAAITGVVWALWHLPLYFIAGYESIENFPAFAIDTFGFAFALAALSHINKNLWPCILLHALLNAGSRVFETKETIAASIVEMAVMIGMAVILVAVYDKKNRQKDKER